MSAEESSITIHKFDNTGDAYDTCQWDESLEENNSILLIESEGVVALPWAWPVAVTVASGELHKVEIFTSIGQLAADAGWTSLQILAAIALAQTLNYEVDPTFLEYEAKILPHSLL